MELTEINIIEEPKEAIDLATASQEDRQLFFDRLAEQTPELPKTMFDNFRDMSVDSVKLQNLITKPDLKELLLRKIIQLCQGLVSDYNIIAVPIIPNLNGTPNYHRVGAAPSMKSVRKEFKKQEKPANAPGAIKVRFDSYILSYTENGMDYIVPPNEEMNIVGLMINPMCAIPYVAANNFLKELKAVKLYDEGDFERRITYGTYDYKYAASTCSDLFTKPDYSIDIAGDSIATSKKFMFADFPGDKLTTLLGLFFDYVVRIVLYKSSREAAIGIQNQIDLVITTLGAPLKTLAPANIGGSKTPMAVPKELMEAFARAADATPILKPIVPDEKKTELVLMLEATLGVNLPASGSKLHSILDNYGMYDVYKLALVKTKDDPAVMRVIEAYNNRQTRIEFRNNIRRKLEAENSTLNEYRRLIEKKLGAKTIAEVNKQLELKPFLVAKAENILSLLKPDEKKLIKLEYDKHVKYVESLIGNKCPHIKLYRKYRTAPIDEQKYGFYKQLMKFAPAKSHNHELIKCNNCGFDLICPHLKEMTEADMSNKKFAEIRPKLTKYFSHNSIGGNYYCNICGEFMMSADTIGETIAPKDYSFTMSEDLKKIIWGEVSMIIKHLKFDGLINTNNFVDSVVRAIYPFVFEIEKQILKSKTNSAEEIKNKKKLFTAIYAFAYIIHLVISNANKSTIEFRNIKKSNAKKYMLDLFAHVIKLIANSKNIIIREIQGMTTDIIKNKLIEAYRLVASRGQQTLNTTTDTENLLTVIMLDPIYGYLYRANLVDDFVSGKLPKTIKNLTSISPVAKLDDYMGATIPQLEKSTELYAKALIPKFASWHKREFESIKPPTHAAKFGTYRQLYPGYYAASFELFWERIKKKSYANNIFVNSSNDSKSKSANITSVDTDEIKAYSVKYDELHRLELDLLAYRDLEEAKNIYGFQHKHSRKWKRPQVSLGRIYDEDGNIHTWVGKPNPSTIYIYESEGERKEVYVAAINSGLLKGEKFTEKIVDKKCGDCGQLYSKAGELDESKILEALSAKSTVDNFFRFYENRCPKGSLHDMSMDKDITKCAKCGFTPQLLTNQTSKAALSYYREFKAIYLKERDEFSATESAKSKTEVKAFTDTTDTQKWAEEYSKWAFNFNVVLDLSNKLKINHKLVTCVGAMEKVEFGEIVEGTYIPPEATSRYDPRIYAIMSHIKNIIMEYNLIRFYYRLGKAPTEIAELIDNSGINKHKLSELADSLPDISDSINQKITWFQRNKKPRETVNFCIQSMCETLLYIYNIDHQITAKLRKDFVAYILKKILKSEEMLTKPGYFNWSLLYGNKEKDTYDSNLNDKLDEETDKYEDESETAVDNFGDTNKPFSRDDLDVDVDPDADPDDDFDPMDIKVGDDYGL